MSLISELLASTFATAAHGAVSQKRKYTGEDYITHPFSVVGIVQGITHTTHMIQAAYLHDVLEDTGVTSEYLRKYFDEITVSYVVGLTDVSKPEDGNRAARKKLDREHLTKQCANVKTIKLADLIHNSRSILEYDPKFAKVYMEEVKLLLPVLKEGNKILHTRLTNIVSDYYDELHRLY